MSARVAPGQSVEEKLAAVLEGTACDLLSSRIAVEVEVVEVVERAVGEA